MQTLSLTNVLRSCDIIVTVICYFDHESSMVVEFQKAGAEVRLLDLNRDLDNWKVIKKIWKEIEQINPDIVHVQYMAPGALPIIAARLARVKNIFATVHQPFTRSHGWLAKLILRAASVLTTRFFAVSENSEMSWFGTSGLFDENKPLKFQPRHCTIYNSVDTARINKIVAEVSVTVLKNELSVPIGIPVIGTVSRFRSEKGIDILLEAFILLIRGGVKAHLLLVGSGPDEKKLKDTVIKFDLNSSVTFVGEVEWDRAMQIMSLMDIVVIPSRFEGFGLAATEAMAMGKPVIASNVYGLKEVVNDGETGVLFKLDDVTALKESIESLIIDAEMRERLGSAGKERVLANFSFEIFSKKIKALYSM